jgi:hypothetical protein
MMPTKAFTITLCIVSFLFLLTIIGNLWLNLKFKKQVRTLFNLSTHASNSKFTRSDIQRLPEPVQRYFRHVLSEGQPIINYASITHNGKFKPGFDKPWVNIRGEQYATTENPGFIWKGETTFFTARDMYIGDQGRLTVSVISLFTVVDAKGAAYDQGELLRWLGESVLYPTNLLPGDRLHWIAIDSHTARLEFNYKGLALFFIASFNDVGEITQLETKRYMDEKNLETWIIKIAGYRQMNAVMVPTKFDVLWRLKKGDFSYAKFNIQTIVYEQPK